MSVINPHDCCPICGAPDYVEFARNEDEALYRCEPNGHVFDSNTPPWDSHEDDPPGTPLAAAGVTRRPSDVDPFRTPDGDAHPKLLDVIDQRVFEIMHARDALALRHEAFGPADILEELRHRGGH